MPRRIEVSSILNFQYEKVPRKLLRFWFLCFSLHEGSNTEKLRAMTNTLQQATNRPTKPLQEPPPKRQTGSWCSPLIDRRRGFPTHSVTCSLGFRTTKFPDISWLAFGILAPRPHTPIGPIDFREGQRGTRSTTSHTHHKHWPARTHSTPMRATQSVSPPPRLYPSLSLSVSVFVRVSLLSLCLSLRPCLPVCEFSKSRHLMWTKRGT